MLACCGLECVQHVQGFYWFCVSGGGGVDVQSSV